MPAQDQVLSTFTLIIMHHVEPDDEPPSLVPTEAADVPVSGVEGRVEELNIGKVPITIVTGQYVA